MLRLPMSPVCVLTTAAACSLVAGHAQAESTDFDTTLTALSGSSFQIDNTFSLLFDLVTVHLDANEEHLAARAARIAHALDEGPHPRLGEGSHTC